MDSTPATVAAHSLVDQVLALPHTRVISTIDPDIATRLLATVDLDVSRRLIGANVQSLAVAMRDGTFDSHANRTDPLTFTAEGHLRNGKQRLVALIMSGTTHIFAAVRHDPQEG